MTPHEQMTQYDKEGTAYWIEDIAIIADTFGFNSRYDVVSHSDEWVQLRWQDFRPFFLNLNQVVSFAIVTQ